MVKQLKKGGNRLKTAYWSLVGMASVALITLQPVMADTIWDRFSKIMKDVYDCCGHSRCDCTDCQNGFQKPACSG